MSIRGSEHHHSPPFVSPLYRHAISARADARTDRYYSGMRILYTAVCPAIAKACKRFVKRVTRRRRGWLQFAICAGSHDSAEIIRKRGGGGEVLADRTASLALYLTSTRQIKIERERERMHTHKKRLVSTYPPPCRVEPLDSRPCT